MLFSSVEFLLAFLPVVMLSGLILGRVAPSIVIILFALAANLFFYGYFYPAYLVLLLGSIGANFVLGRRLIKAPGKALLTMGVVINLVVLGFFKYGAFFASNVGLEFDTLTHLVLPLAISFYTFQQISFLVDCHRGEIPEVGLARYAVYVSFFPQLIAGPIVRFQELYPQLDGRLFRPNAELFARGLTLFIFGLAKKVLIADVLSEPVDAIWGVLHQGGAISTPEAWFAVFAYSFQIYFDFSAYSDMAIGLGLMMGVQLPVNFMAPYRATSIRDFWQRWHITLSTWLRDYLYIPLGGNRKGRGRQVLAIFVTMALGGLWHGAGWNFVLWGVLHGVWIAASHLLARSKPEQPAGMRRVLATAITFLGVTFLWIFFRGEHGLWDNMLRALVSGPDATKIVIEKYQYGVLVCAALIAFLVQPNARVFFLKEGAGRLRYTPNAGFALLTGLLFFLALMLMIEGEPNAFIYFQF